MKYYIGEETPPDHFPLTVLYRADLRQGRKAVQSLLKALEEGQLRGRDQQSIEAWASTPERRRTLSQAIDFLKGKRLEEADEVYREEYARFLREPQCRAALLLLCDNEVQDDDQISAEVAKAISLRCAQILSL